MSAIKCASCGKFRKESDCVLQEENNSDGFQLDQYFECKYCMSGADYERYFKKKELENENKV